MSNIRNLLEKMDQFAGQAVGQKPGDQVRGTDKATRKKSGEHPFKGRLVGANESAGSLLRELQQELDKPEATVRRDLFREFAEFKQDVSETFDQSYKIKSEKSAYGDVDMMTKLPDGTYLNIMFNNHHYNGDDVWEVDFYRNNRQDVTGEGDAQRIFATVLNAIQKFVKKYKPEHLKFLADKDVRSGRNGESRTKLYDRLVQRYARAWGYRAFRAETGRIVQYEFSRLSKVVAEEDAWHSAEDAPQDAWHSSQDAPQDAWHGATAESEGDAEGLPHLTTELVSNILQQMKTHGPQAISKSIEWGDGAAAELTELIRDAMEDYLNHADLDEEIAAPMTPGVAPTAPAANTAANPAAVAQMKAQQLKTLAAQKKSTQDQIKQTQEQLDALRKQLASLSNPANVAMPSVTGTV